MNCLPILDKNQQRSNKQLDFDSQYHAVMFSMCSKKNNNKRKDYTHYFDGDTINEIIKFVNQVHEKYKSVKIPIMFNIGKVCIKDKLTYVIFECICYVLQQIYGHRIYVFLQCIPTIQSEGWRTSSLIACCNNGMLSKDFKKKFVFNLQKNHFRKFITSEQSEDGFLGAIFQDIVSVIRYSDYGLAFNDEYAEEVAEVAIELIGNAFDHGLSGCLMDIDITDHEYVEIINGVDYDCCGINIVILNISDILFKDGIEKKIRKARNCNDAFQENHSSKEAWKRFNELIRIKIFHEKFFNKTYTVEDFYNIAAMQDRISGRPEISNAGGKGLTVLIKSLQDRADNDFCYMLSGNRGLAFKHDVLRYDKNGWIGFNKNGTFKSEQPELNVLLKCPVYIPGTAYNLTFVKRYAKNDK